MPVTTDPFPAIERYVAANLDRYAKTAPDYQVPADWIPAMAAEFVYGNSNGGVSLLNRGGVEKCALLAQRLKTLGLASTVLTVHEDVWRHERASDFLAFYKAVVATIRNAGLGLIVETACPFLAPPLTDYEAHVATRQRAVQTIAGELLQPGDTLIIADEPDSEFALTGFAELKTPTGYAAFTRRILDAVPYVADTLIGAGAGSWQTLPWHDALLRLPLHVTSLHVYPTHAGALTRIGAVAARAAALGRRVGVGEMWAMKATAAELAAPGKRARVNAILARDVFAFWARTDCRFLEAMAGMARRYGLAYLSPFNTPAFFAYLDDSPGTRYLGYEGSRRLQALAMDRALRTGTLTETGRRYAELIAGTEE